MRMIYLSFAKGVSILCLMLQSASVLAETRQPAAVTPEPVVTTETMSAKSYTFPEAQASNLKVLEPSPATSPLITQTPTKVVPQDQTAPTNTFESQVTSVNQLSDVQPTDWAFLALQSLIKRYGVIAGYPNRAYRGNRAMTRYEFAAGINAALERVNELIASGLKTQVSREDLLTLQQLQEEFAAELTTLRGRVDSLEVRTAKLEANQFSTTTKLSGLLVTAVSAGSFSGRRIIDPTGAKIADKAPSTTFVYRASLNLSTSFTGTDLLLTRLEQGDGGPYNNAPGNLEPNFGSVLDYSYRSAGEQPLLTRLYYTFTPFKDFAVTVGPTITAPDFVDRNSYSGDSYLNFSTLAFNNNYIAFPVLNLGAGGLIEWRPWSGPLKVRAIYVAGEGANPIPNKQSSRASVSPLVDLLYPKGDGKNGLFGNPNQTNVELEYTPSKTFALRLLYSGGNVFGGRFDVFGVNAELALSKHLAFFGRYGYGSYSNTNFGNIKPNYWMAGVEFRDLFKPGALAGIAAGQPFIESAVGNATQTNFEGYYNLPLNDHIRLSPVIQIITNPANQESNGTIYTGTLRTSITF
ncbi:MAG: carbohydrate porin [Stigonema ocellatum SAG 48.90 = DSM 106950]|nr:carbohydrate porin [Stigonema ocellatum SAG 48.90 = DSM 106950]